MCWLSSRNASPASWIGLSGERPVPVGAAAAVPAQQDAGWPPVERCPTASRSWRPAGSHPCSTSAAVGAVPSGSAAASAGVDQCAGGAEAGFGGFAVRASDLRGGSDVERERCPGVAVCELPGRGDRVVSARARPAYDRWRDINGAHIPDGCRVEQVAVAKEHGALTARRGKRGEVLGRTQRGNRLRVRFDGEPSRPVDIRPHLLRVVPVMLSMPALSFEGIVAQLRELQGDLHMATNTDDTKRSGK